MLKCSRCGNVFPAPAAKKLAPPPPPTAEEPPPAVDGNLTLPFEDGAWKDEPEPEPEDHFIGPEQQEEFTLGVGHETEETAAVRQPPAPPPVVRVLAQEPEPDEPEMEVEERQTFRPEETERSGVTAILIFLAIVLAAYGVLTRALFASPALCDRLVGRLPLIGRLSDDRLLIRKVALSDVAGNYQRIKDGKEVFVITGKALNTAPVALQAVQIVGKVYDTGGQLLDQKVIYCGNVVSAKVLKDLTPRELSILQKLSPPKRFMIEPGESSTFVIVFMDPPRQAVEFSTQVLAVQRQA